jgi:glycosyltransferase involved in cell wall biosynthesis
LSLKDRRPKERRGFCRPWAAAANGVSGETVRIVYYVAGWPPDRFPNGVVTATAALAPALREAGHEALILSHQGAPDGPDADVTFVDPARLGVSIGERVRNRLSPQASVFETAPRHVARRINATPELKTADIIEMEESFGWSKIVAENIAPPVVTRLHGPWFINGAAQNGAAGFSRYDEERIRREKVAIAASASVSAPSRYVLDAVRNYYDLELPSAAVIPNAVAKIPDDQVWRRGGADPDEILFVGRFDRHKGGDTMLLAFAELARDRPRLKLTFAGPKDRAIQAGVKTLSFGDFLKATMPEDAARRVNALGPVPFARLGELRRRAFVTVICSRIEIFPGVVAESLAHGAPTVATAVGGIPEIIRDGVDGLLAAPENPFAAAASVRTLLDDPDLAARLGESGRRRVLAEYSPERVSEGALAYYRDVIAARPRAGRS